MSTKPKTIKNVDIDVLHAFDKYKATLPEGTNDAQAFAALMKLTELKPADTKDLDEKITTLQTEVNRLTNELNSASQRVSDYENLKTNATTVGEENQKLQNQIIDLQEKNAELEGQIQPPPPELTPDEHLMEVIKNDVTIKMMRKVRPFYKKDHPELNDSNWASHLVDKSLIKFMKYEYEDLF